VWCLVVVLGVRLLLVVALASESESARLCMRNWILDVLHTSLLSRAVAIMA
jgi:hypothetical protein